MKKKGHGYIADVITPEDYRLGGTSDKTLSGLVLNPSGQWDDFLPPDEYQNRNGLETMACTTYGTLNCIETLTKKKFGFSPNYSERYIAKLSGTTRSGNSPHKVAETIRKLAGVIDDDLLPFGDEINTWDEFYTEIGKTLLDRGRDWLSDWDFGHEWVLSGKDRQKVKKLKQALTFSPVGIAVDAWKKDGELYIKDGEDNHWCMLYGYEDKKYWKVLDHYDNTHKKLAWNYDFRMAKWYTVDKKTTNNWLADLLKRLFV